MPENNTSIKISNLSFTYPGLNNYIIDNFSASVGRGWTAVCGNNGSGKSTLLKLMEGTLAPTSGSIKKTGSFFYCSQEFQIDEPDLSDFFYSFFERGSDAGKLASLLKIKKEWFDIFYDSSNRFSESPAELSAALSEGEKKRLQTACALYRNPDILAMDEPFNHLDEEGRMIITEALSFFEGTGLIVSHDRVPVDRLCSNTILIENGSAEYRRGSVTEVLRQLELERESSRNNYKKTKSEIIKLKAESGQRRNKADNADRQRSKKGISGKDHDAKAKIDLARLTGKDGHAGKLYKQIDGRIRKKEKQLSEINIHSESKAGITISDIKCRRDSIVSIKQGTISMGSRKLSFPDLVQKPGEKISITGNNGTGKTTLINHILEQSETERDRILYIPQEPGKKEKEMLLNRIRLLPDSEKGMLYSNFSRLGSDASKIMETHSPSPGEWKKLILSEGILRNPYLIILDEPLNHMDINSIVSFEEALIKIECALLVVSHDRNFRKSVTQKEWRINEGKPDNFMEIIPF